MAIGYLRPDGLELTTVVLDALDAQTVNGNLPHLAILHHLYELRVVDLLTGFRRGKVLEYH